MISHDMYYMILDGKDYDNIKFRIVSEKYVETFDDKFIIKDKSKYVCGKNN